MNGNALVLAAGIGLGEIAVLVFIGSVIVVAMLGMRRALK